MLKGYIWKYYTIKMEKMKAVMGFEPAHNEKNIFLQAATLPTELFMLTTKTFSKQHLTSEYASLMFWFHCLQTNKCKHSHNIAAAL